ISDDPIEQQRRTFREPGRNLRDSANLEIGMCAIHVSEHIHAFHRGNELAQIPVHHDPILRLNIGPGSLFRPSHLTIKRGDAPHFRAPLPPPRAKPAWARTTASSTAYGR